MSRIPRQPMVDVVPPGRWVRDAACAGYIHLFDPLWPLWNGSYLNRPMRFILENARTICNRCPVQLECLQHGTDHEPHGMWGGTLPAERGWNKPNKKWTAGKVKSKAKSTTKTEPETLTD